MSDDHHHQRAPRQMLKARVRDHVNAITELGLEPNRTLVLGGTTFSAWLLDDPFIQATSRRWLLLSDGDVWCEAAYMAGPWHHDQGAVFGWLTAPVPALESVLGLSLDEAFGGGPGLLVSPSPSSAPLRVADRRSPAERRSDADRRRGHQVPPEVERRQGDRRAGPDRRQDA